MSYGKNNNRFKIPGGGVLVPWSILNSLAYRKLSASAAKVLPFFLGKVKCGKRTGLVYASAQYYNFEFNFSYKEAKRYGLATSTYSGSIKQLVSKGFIDPVVRGGMKGAGLSYSWFKLSARWNNYKMPNFVEIEWVTLVPKPRKKKKGFAYPFLPSTDISNSFPTSESEMNSSSFRNNEPPFSPAISESEAVDGVIA